MGEAIHTLGMRRISELEVKKEVEGSRNESLITMRIKEVEGTKENDNED